MSKRRHRHAQRSVPEPVAQEHITTLAAAAPHAEPPATAPGLQPQQGWEELWPGPYKRFPEPSRAVAEYWLMRTYEPTCRRVLGLIRQLFVSHLGAYRHPDKALAERVNGWLRQIDGGMAGVVGRMLSSLWAGFCVCQPVWETRADAWVVKRVDLLHPLTFFSPWGMADGRQGIQIDPKTGTVETLRQYGAHGRESVEYAVGDVLYWPLMPELREQVYGSSLLTSARRAWYCKTRLENYWNTFAEKAAMPTPVFTCPPGTVRDPETGQEITIGAFLVKQWSRAVPGTAIALPMQEGLVPGVTSLVPSDGASVAFERITEYWKNELFNSMFTPRIVLEEPEHASRAQTSTVLDLYYENIDGWRGELGDVIVSQLVSRLLRYNVGEVDEPGEWAWEPLQTSDMEMLARVFETIERGKSQAANSGAPLAGADDAKLREAFPSLYAPASDAGEPRMPAGTETQQSIAQHQAMRYLA